MKYGFFDGPIIIDTDAGHDDVLAMMLAIKAGLPIVGITGVAGNSTIRNVGRNIAYTLDLLGRRDIPVFTGSSKPLKRSLLQAVVHGKSGLEGADTSDTRFRLTGDAPEKIIELVRRYPKEITILTLGPLSNIARALRRDRAIESRIKEIVIMGGAIDVCGNKNRVAEFNLFVDPEAADIVFRSSIPKVLIPIDICCDMPLFLSDFQEIEGSALYEPIMSMMRQFIHGIETHEGTKGVLVYDAVAAYYLLRPSAFQKEQMDIAIETKGEHTAGMTVVERRISAKKQYNVTVAMKLERKQFVRDFLQALQ